MKSKTRDIICSLLFLIVGIFTFVNALEIKPLMAKDLGSGFMPKVIGVSLIVIAVMKLVLTLTNKKESKIETSNDNIDQKGGLLTIGIFLFYVITFEMLGFIVSTIVYLFFQMLILSNDKNRNCKLFALISIVFSVAVYVLFVYVINRPLPIGIFVF